MEQELKQETTETRNNWKQWRGTEARNRNLSREQELKQETTETMNKNWNKEPELK
jgi:hypothetical protein